LAVVVALSGSASATIARLGLGGGPMYTGSGVGPLWLFRSSADNAAIVKDGFQGHPIARTLFTAFGDELPNLRDDVIRRLKDQAATNAISGSTQSRSGISGLLQNPFIGSVISPSNWRLDRENGKKEIEEPFKRNGLLSSVTSGLGGALGGLGGGGGGGSGGGLLGSLGGLVSSFTGGGSSSSSFGGSSSGSSSSGGGFRITADSATRAPVSPSINSVEESPSVAPALLRPADNFPAPISIAQKIQVFFWGWRP
ncbi:unnamed protein product, partial [Allacma fusca]